MEPQRSRSYLTRTQRRVGFANRLVRTAWKLYKRGNPPLLYTPYKTQAIKYKRFPLAERMKRRGRGGARNGKRRRRGRLSGRRLVRYQPSIREKKFHDTSFASAAMGTTWGNLEDATQDCLNGIAQQFTESAHQGRNYFIHSITIHGWVTVSNIESATAPLDDLAAKIALYQDTATLKLQKDPSADIFDTGSTNNVLAFRKLQNVGQFKVLARRSFLLTRDNQSNEGAVNLFASGLRIKPWTIYKRFNPPMIVRTSGTDNTITSIEGNSLHLCGCASTTAVKIQYECRIRFTD